MRFVIFATILLLLATACSGGSDAESLPLQVCAEDPAWKRPAAAEHEAYMRADPRWRDYDARAEEQFAAHFWSDANSASGAGFVLEFSGLWTLPNQGRDLYWSAMDPSRPGVDRASLLTLWLFEHQATSAIEDGRTLRVTVEPRPAGVQIIALSLTRPLLDSQYKIEFVDSSGQLVGRLDDQLWSRGP